MKSTSVLSALALSFVLAAVSGSAAVAQEYITTQSVELNQAIARAEAAKTIADSNDSVRGQQISKYIGEILAQAKSNNYKNADDLTRVLNDAATATPLLLGTNQTTAKAAETTTSVRTSGNTAPINAPATVSEPALTADTNEEVAVLSMGEDAVAEKETVAVTPVAKNSGVAIRVEVKAQPEVEVSTANPEENTVVLANAHVESTVNNINSTPEASEVPNTGETKNPVGKFVATAVAAIVAMGGAVLIVKRMKKNA